MNIKTEHTLNKRYFYKICANIVTFGIGIISQAFVARGLGPSSYGSYSFLTNFFSQLTNFFNMGSSTAFYTKLSNSQKDYTLVLFYFRLVILVGISVIGFVICANITSIDSRIWPNQSILYVYLAAFFGLFAWVVQVINSMADAYGLTVSAEIAKIIQKLIGLLFLSILFFTGKLSLVNYFLYQYFIFLLLSILVVKIIYQSKCFPKNSWKISLDALRSHVKSFYTYCHPLFIYSSAALICVVMDRWMLEKFSGSVQQGFYGFSYQIGVVCFLFTSAMTPLLMREFSISFGKNDISKMAIFFRTYIPVLYSIAAFFSCFIVFQASKVIYILGGDKYKEALWVVTIMALYPIHQTYGQLSASVFYSSGQTQLFRNIGVIFLLIGMPVTYFLIAPNNLGGLNMGAIGLAVKMVVIQFLVVNVQLFFNAKFLKISFWKYFMHQILTLVCLLFFSYLVTVSVEFFLGSSGKYIQSILISGVVYTIIVFIIFYIYPPLFGLKRIDINKARNLLISKFRNNIVNNKL
ncbi:MAG: oligosaccharide flippase family protein [Candidatus Ancaeobacter aquaticus]|nr:oligosaccharide flippase family protein [Candidatus Ancaeobacter aquaticus]